MDIECRCCQEKCSELFPMVNPHFGVPTEIDLVCSSCALFLQSEYFEELFRHPLASLPLDGGRVVGFRSLTAKRVA